MRTKEHGDAHASNNKATSHTEALAISHLTRVKRSTTRRIQKRANARHCRLKFIEFRLAVKRGEGKRGFKGSRNTTRLPQPTLIHFSRVSRKRAGSTVKLLSNPLQVGRRRFNSTPNKSNRFLFFLPMVSIHSIRRSKFGRTVFFIGDEEEQAKERCTSWQRKSIPPLLLSTSIYERTDPDEWVGK